MLASTHSPAYKQFSSHQPLCSILMSFQGDLPFSASPSGHQPGISWGASFSGHPHPLIRAKKYNQESISSGSILCTFQPPTHAFLPGNSDLNFAFLFCTHEELMLMRELRLLHCSLANIIELDDALFEHTSAAFCLPDSTVPLSSALSNE